MVTVKEQKQKILVAMDETDPYSKEYAILTQRLMELVETNSKELSLTNPILWSAATSFGGIVLVTLHERMHVITTRAFGLIKK